MNKIIVTAKFSKFKLLKHYLHHCLIACIGLLITFLAFGSITVWEGTLFFIMTFFPLFDNFTHATFNYLKSQDCRKIINYFLAGEITMALYLLHEKRLLLNNLTLHNIPVYISLWALLFVFLIFDAPLPFYALSAVLIHLMLDIINDEYEFATLSKWLWPIFYVFPS